MPCARPRLYDVPGLCYKIWSVDTNPKKPPTKTLDAALELVSAWGSRGGKKGGKLRWKGVTSEQRRAHAKKAAAARWAKKKKPSK